jgi:hypothetical protein
MRWPCLSLLVVVTVVACSKREEAKPDSAAAAAAAPPPAPAAPAAITEADVAGTWTGTAMMTPGDSVFAHWTQVCASGTCNGTSQEQPKDTVKSTYTLEADSSVGVGQPVAMKGIKGKVIDHWVARPKGTAITGTGWMTLASKPDSVVLRYRFEGTKKS